MSDLSARPLRSYGVVWDLTALLRRCRGVVGDLIALLRRCRGVVGDLTALLRRCRGDPTALLSGRRSHGVCFKHAQSARRRPAIYAISRRSLAMPRRCLRFHGAQVGVLDLLERRGNTSADVFDTINVSQLNNYDWVSGHVLTLDYERTL